MHHTDDITFTHDNGDHKADIAPRHNRVRDMTRIALGAGIALVIGAGFATATGGAPQGVQPPDPATMIPGPASSPSSRAKQSARRDAVRWPLNPTARDLTVRGVNIKKFLALGRCEAGPGDGHAGIRFRTPSGWKWQGAYGLYAQTHQSVGHPYGADAGQMSWQEQTLVAQRVMERYGIHAWGGAHCYIAT